MKTIGEKIRELRRIHNMSQAELGEKVFVTYQAVSKWERGESEPSFNMLLRICELFDISIDGL